MGMKGLLAVSMGVLSLAGLACNGNKLEAEGSPTPVHTQTDTFTQNNGNGKSDILFIINNTDATMVVKATRLGTSATGFMSYLLSQGIDFHIAVTSMDMNAFAAHPDAPGCLQAIGSLGCFGGTPRVIDQTTPSLLATFQSNLQVGFAGDVFEKGIDAGLTAITPPLSTGANAGFLRSDARLFVIYITDENDVAGAPGNPLAPFNPPAYISAYAAVKAGNAAQVVFSAIAGDVPNGCGGGAANGSGGDPGIEYQALITASHGLFESVCDPDYTQFLNNLGFQLAALQSTFPLSGVPTDPATIQVTVNGTAVPAADYTYSAATNAITFAPASIPPAGASVVITYDVP